MKGCDGKYTVHHTQREPWRQGNKNRLHTHYIKVQLLQAGLRDALAIMEMVITIIAG